MLEFYLNNNYGYIMSQHYDTYFFSSKRAQNIAKEKNRLKPNSNEIQICYNSDNLNDKNLVNVSIENFKEFFKTSSYRYPAYIDFIDSQYEDNEEIQNKLVKVFATIFEEISKDELVLTNKLINEFNNLHIKHNNKIIFLSSKKQPQVFEYLKKLSKEFKNDGFKTKFITEKSKKDMVLDNLRFKDVLLLLLRYSPSYIINFNEFYPQLFHKDITNIHILNSFNICNKIIEYEGKIDLKKNVFFGTNSYYEKLLKEKSIKVIKLMPIVQDIPNNTKLFENREIDLTIHDNKNDLDEYIVFKKMIKKVFKYLDESNLLTVDKIISFIKTTNYPNTKDWELNLYLYNNILEKYFIDINKKIKKVKIISNCFSESYGNTKYVLVLSANIVTSELLNILKYKAIPIVYDLRDEDNYYDKVLDDYCLFIKNKSDLKNIIKNEIKPKKYFDEYLKERYSFRTIFKDIVKLI